MNSYKKFTVFPIILIFLLGMIGFSNVNSKITPSKITSTNANQLLIYTYESLFADPEYDIEGNFSFDSGIPKDDIQIIRLEDANEIVTRLLSEKDQPQADVVIGIDNALIHLIEDIDEVLETYNPSVIDEIDDNLIQNLDPAKYLIPYDYGIISFYYWNHIINSSSHPELENLTLENLLDSKLLSMLLIENPKFSSPGLGFLLWTIAVYGDPEIKFDGLLKKNWRTWWSAANDSITITKSWGDAFDIFYNPDEGKPIMISYGTSPAYSLCHPVWGGDNRTSAIVTHENGTPNAWLQIEGVGLVKNAPHEENAKNFINWFLSKELQSELPMHQWMYPANTEANISECFSKSVISPDEVNRLNDLIPPTMLKEHLTKWQDEWEQVIVQRAISGFESIVLTVGLIIASVPVLLKRRRSSK